MMGKRKSGSLSNPGVTDESGNPGSPTPPEPSLGSAPTAKDADDLDKANKKANAETASAKKEEPKRQLTSVPLRVFGQLSGLKPDQFRPFYSYATREEMRPCPVPEWHTRLEAFKSKPTPQLNRLAR